MKKHQPCYVFAGRREDGSWGVIRTVDSVKYYTKLEKAEEDIKPYRDSRVIIDISLIVDHSLLESSHNGFMDVSGRRNKNDK